MEWTYIAVQVFAVAFFNLVSFPSNALSTKVPDCLSPIYLCYSKTLFVSNNCFTTHITFSFPLGFSSFVNPKCPYRYAEAKLGKLLAACFTRDNGKKLTGLTWDIFIIRLSFIV
jgi:hypothetical protein